MSHFIFIEEYSKIDDIHVFTLYEYNDYFRSLLYRYKANYDYELKGVFLAPFLSELKRKYRGYKVIPAPSSNLANQKRGFKPMLEIAKELDLEIIDCLYKIDEYKQSDQKYKDRKNIQEHIRIHDVDLTNQKILWIDDVSTSNHTLLTCCRLIQEKHPKRIEVLLLSRRIQKGNVHGRKSKIL